jgi:adenylosuccinate synthase
MSVYIVVGGQFGSEGKGKVAAFISKQDNIDICVRCGGPNSGHSFVDETGKMIVLRQLPTGFVNPHSRLLLPAGALIDPYVLKEEIEFLNLPMSRIGVDRKCFVIEDKDRRKEQELRLRERISSTLCGVGAAVSRRVMREGSARLAKDIVGEHPWMSGLLTDVTEEVNTGLDHEKKVLVEGTQGFGLSLYHSQHYPHTTSRDTTASGFLSEVGISPRYATEIIVVFRTFPIRVEGQQAGPMLDEIRWDDVQSESGYPVPVSEYTTVTKRLRRVARFDWVLARRAVLVNRPTRIAINGLDLLSFSNRGVIHSKELDHRAVQFIRDLENQTGSPVGYCGTGPSLQEMFSISAAAKMIAEKANTASRVRSA